MIGDADVFLDQVSKYVQGAHTTLARLFETKSPAFQEVVKAKVLLDAMHEWVKISQVRRSGGPASDPLHVPESVWKAAEDLTRAGRSLARYWVELHPDRAQAPFTLDPKLDEAALDCLQALEELGATSIETRQTGEAIAKRALDADADRVKRTLAELSKLGLADSKTGRGGGSWIAAYGQQVLKTQRPR